MKRWLSDDALYGIGAVYPKGGSENPVERLPVFQRVGQIGSASATPAG